MYTHTHRLNYRLNIIMTDVWLDLLVDKKNVMANLLEITKFSLQTKRQYIHFLKNTEQRKQIP